MAYWNGSIAKIHDGIHKTKMGQEITLVRLLLEDGSHQVREVVSRACQRSMHDMGQ